LSWKELSDREIWYFVLFSSLSNDKTVLQLHFLLMAPDISSIFVLKGIKWMLLKKPRSLLTVAAITFYLTIKMSTLKVN
jgi:hypothetical protein